MQLHHIMPPVASHALQADAIHHVVGGVIVTRCFPEPSTRMINRFILDFSFLFQ
jgi:hypothetical protein